MATVSGAVHPQPSPDADGLPSLTTQAAEEHRWLAWIGTPIVISAIFMGISFGTGQAWVLTFSVIAIIADILILIMLTLSTDTNSRTVEGPAAHSSG